MLGIHVDAKELSALGGAASALLAAVSYWWKTRHERRRATRTALFYLLELHHVLRRVRSASIFLKSEFAPTLRSALLSRGLPVDEAQFAAAVAEALPAFERFGRLQIEDSVAGVSDGLSRALVDLAKEDPVLAFRLRGRDQLLVMPQTIEAFLAASAGEFSATREAQGKASNLDEFLSSVSLEELELSIHSTASRCDIGTRRQTSALLKEAKQEQSRNELKAVVDRLADDFAASVIKN